MYYQKRKKRYFCKGINFAIPPKKLKFENYLLLFETLFRDVCDNSNKVSDDDCLLDVKCKTKDIGLSSFRWYNKKDSRFENLTKDEYTAFLSLKSNSNINKDVRHLTDIKSNIRHCFDNLLKKLFKQREL